MRHLATILCLCAILSSQTPDQWWQLSDSSQRAFADSLYDIGFRYGDKGHTAVGLGWSESSLGADITHNEDSYKYFGLSEIALLDLGCEVETFDSLKAGLLTLERETFLALDYYFLQETRLRRNGFTPAESWFWAYPKYSAGNKYRRFKQRGIIFSERVAFLKTQFK